MKRILLPALMSGCLHLSALGEDSGAASGGKPEKELHKIEGIFNTDLPKTERKGSVRVILHPHFGDFTSRSYVRIPLGLRWGVNDHVELSGTIESYVEHHLKDGAPGTGIGDLQFGAKYAFSHFLKPDYDTSVGINLRFPVGHPPSDLTDGYNHYSPYLVIAKKIKRTPGLTIFFGPVLDIMAKSSVPGSFRKNDPHSTNLLLSGGFVYDRFPFHYTLESGFQTTSLIGHDNQQFVFVRPGIAWDLPRTLTFNSRGRWLIGVSARITVGPDGTGIDGGGKLRGELNLKRWFRSQ